MSTDALYIPHKIAERAIIATTDSPYTLPAGVVTTYDLGSGNITALFPASPLPNDTVTIKNTRSRNIGSNVLTLDPNGAEVEIPGGVDTPTLTTSSFPVSYPGQSTRWMFVENTSPPPTGSWIIDHDYSNRRRPVAVTADATAYDGDVMLVDTTLGDITITLDSAAPERARISVNKTTIGSNAVIISADSIQPARVPGSYGTTILLLYEGETVDLIRHNSAWHLISDSITDYSELYYLPTPVDVTATKALLNISLHPSWTRSLLFDSNVSGLLTVTTALDQPFVLTMDVQVVLEHNLTANNADVWAQVVPEVTSDTGGTQIIVPIDAAFAHTRSGIFGDTRSSTSIAVVDAGDTIGIYAEEIASTSASSDVEGLLVNFKA